MESKIFQYSNFIQFSIFNLVLSGETWSADFGVRARRAGDPETEEARQCVHFLSVRSRLGKMLQHVDELPVVTELRAARAGCAHLHGGRAEGALLRCVESRRRVRRRVIANCLANVESVYYCPFSPVFP